MKRDKYLYVVQEYNEHGEITFKSHDLLTYERIMQKLEFVRDNDKARITWVNGCCIVSWYL